ncbi:DUF6518 family protein [Promicromonospora thailandica]|uniref:Uncharacterized protein n=1 Tax=Promicromonospora thailandica TaxID=765201 RepID=A0A9X2JXL5_9MICO|nr:DUF6518 family protein [Promicromonospora thailandica]MCP2264289.1 hypothetical protein [Promicromonospora thailandica]BFF21030.1 hypothetical protein GCM10025730_45510 [Promicromonospora thailandica]
MTTVTRAPSAGAVLSRPLARAFVVVLLSFVLGGLTSYAQGFLPDGFRSFANSASGWTVLTAALVYWSRARTGAAAALGPVGFAVLLAGYSVAAQVRGYYYDPTLWIVLGVLAGPFVGMAAAWLRTEGIRAALGTALLAGIGVGEAVYGLTVISETTSPVYWTVIGLAGVALLAGMLARRIREPLAAVAAVVGTLVLAAAFVTAYMSLG